MAEFKSKSAQKAADVYERLRDGVADAYERAEDAVVDT